MTTTAINTGVNSLSAAKATTEIENGVTLYEFNSEAETEAAVIECIEKGVKFNTTGRRSLVVYQPAPAVADEYAVTYGGEAPTTDTTNNVLAALKSELQEYHNNAAKGGANRRRNMVLLAWDIRRIERKQNASTMRDKVKALMLSAGYVLANGSTLKEHTADAELSQYLDSVAWVCLQNGTLSICKA